MTSRSEAAGPSSSLVQVVVPERWQTRTWYRNGRRGVVAETQEGTRKVRVQVGPPTSDGDRMLTAVQELGK